MLPSFLAHLCHLAFDRYSLGLYHDAIPWLLSAAAVGVGLFLRAEARAASPLVPLGMFRNPLLGAGLAMSALVTTVVMATLSRA